MPGHHNFRFSANPQMVEICRRAGRLRPPLTVCIIPQAGAGVTRLTSFEWLRRIIVAGGDALGAPLSDTCRYTVYTRGFGSAPVAGTTIGRPQSTCADKLTSGRAMLVPTAVQMFSSSCRRPRRPSRTHPMDRQSQANPLRTQCRAATRGPPHSGSEMAGRRSPPYILIRAGF